MTYIYIYIYVSLQTCLIKKQGHPLNPQSFAKFPGYTIPNSRFISSSNTGGLMFYMFQVSLLDIRHAYNLVFRYSFGLFGHCLLI